MKVVKGVKHMGYRLFFRINSVHKEDVTYFEKRYYVFRKKMLHVFRKEVICFFERSYIFLEKKLHLSGAPFASCISLHCKLHPSSYFLKTVSIRVGKISNITSIRYIELRLYMNISSCT